MSVLKKISQAVIDGSKEDVEIYVEEALGEKLAISDIIDQGLIAGMAIIGDRFKKFEIYVPEVLIAARAMRYGMKILEPFVATSQSEKNAVILVGTVKGDLHDIGKNIVIMMLEGAGYKVIDLGIDVPAEKFVESAKEHYPQIIGLSALLTTTIPEMKSSIELIKSYDKNIKVIVGGAPVTQKYADSIGADGFAPDAASAVDVVKELLM